jgi:dGTPase
MRADDRLALQEEQREVVAGLVAQLSARPDSLMPTHRADFEAAGSETARLRAVVDQVASLTDASAVAWHRRLG